MDLRGVGYSGLHLGSDSVVHHIQTGNQTQQHLGYGQVSLMTEMIRLLLIVFWFLSLLFSRS